MLRLEWRVLQRSDHLGIERFHRLLVNLVRITCVIILPDIHIVRLKLLQLLLVDNLLQELLEHQRQVRHEEVTSAD